MKKESEVNAAKEDTQVKTQTESVLQDTVEWVESTKTPVGGSGNDGAYVEVKKADVPDPSASASLVFDKFYGVKSQKPGLCLKQSSQEIRLEKAVILIRHLGQNQKLNRQMSRLNHQNLKRLQ